MTQNLIPVSDLNSLRTTWEKHGSASFFGAIDDSVDSHDGDTSYLKPVAVDDVVKVKLTAGTTPGKGAAHTIRVASKLETCNFGVDLQADLHQGSTLIASPQFAHGPQGSIDDPDPLVHCVREYALTPTEVALITDYGALSFWFYATIGHGVTDGLHLTAAGLRIE